MKFPDNYIEVIVKEPNSKEWSESYLVDKDEIEYIRNMGYSIRTIPKNIPETKMNWE